MPHETRRIPLLRDSHTHPLLYSAFLGGVDLSASVQETRPQALARIASAARAGEGGWTIAFGWNNARYPLSARDFEDLGPVVVFNLSLHGLIVNRAGRAWLERIEPQSAANLDDPLWMEQNLLRVLELLVRDVVSPAGLSRFYDWLLQEHGIWHAQEMLLLGQREIELFHLAGLCHRTRFWASAESYASLSPSFQAQVYGIKLFADGALGASTAALYSPYRTTGQAGLMMYQPETLKSALQQALALGKPLAIHAIGDRAIDQVVGALEALAPAPQREIRIEHAQFITPATARRAKAMGVCMSMQPNFSQDSVHYADRLPAGYAARNNPFRMLIDEVGYAPGVDLVFGSDGMPHGVREGLRQALFPPCDGQLLALDEFVAGYCMPEAPGGIEIRIDPRTRQVSGRVQLCSPIVG